MIAVILIDEFRPFFWSYIPLRKSCRALITPSRKVTWRFGRLVRSDAGLSARTQSVKQSIDENRLSHEDLSSRVGNSEPSRSVDFRKGPMASGTRRPFHLEGVAADERGIPVAFDGPRMYDFAARLPRLPEWQENSLRVMSSLLGEFAPSGGQRRFIGANQTFRDAPGTVIHVLPKWSAWMSEQDFEIGGAPSKQEEPGALRFPRSHRGR